jgi:hypothetical protein
MHENVLGYFNQCLIFAGWDRDLQTSYTRGSTVGFNPTSAKAEGTCWTLMGPIKDLLFLACYSVN